MTLLGAAGVVLAALAYLVLCHWSPFARCPGVWWRRLLALVGLIKDPSCTGGKYVTGRRHGRVCTRCNGEGWVMRRGRKITNGLRRQKIGAR